MKIQVLVAAMNQSDHSLIKKMNIANCKKTCKGIKYKAGR